MRRVWTVLAVAAAAIAAVVQLAADATYGAVAEPHSLPALIVSEAPLRSALAMHLDALPGMRLTLARAAVYRRDETAATALLAALPAGPAADDLRGRHAEQRGAADEALRAYLAAGDFESAQTLIDQLADRDPVAAVGVVHAFTARISEAGYTPEIAAQAFWRQGVIEAAAGYRVPAQRTPYWAAALASYARALALAPNEETYLLAYAYQALANGDATTAQRSYTRATQVVPDSVDAFIGLAMSSAATSCDVARDAAIRARGYAAAQHRAIEPLGANYPATARRAFERCAR